MPRVSVAASVNFWVYVPAMTGVLFHLLFSGRYGFFRHARVENVPLSESIARVFNSLGTKEKQNCGILACNYGQAAAVDYFGPAYGLPKAISGHNQYGLWGTRGFNGDVVIAIGFTEQQLRENFGQASPAAQVRSRYAIPKEANLTVYLCRMPKTSLREISVKLKWLG